MPNKGSWRFPVEARFAAINQWPYPSSNGSGICAAKRSEEQQDCANAKQGERWTRGPQSRQGAPSEVAQGQDLERVDRAERCQDEKADGEHARVEHEQPLVHHAGKRHDGKRTQPEKSLRHRVRISDSDVRLVAPFLPGLLDPVLRRPDKLSAPPRRAKKSKHRRQRHAGTDDLAQQRGQARPPPPPEPNLGDDETEPRRNGDHDHEH